MRMVGIAVLVVVSSAGAALANHPSVPIPSQDQVNTSAYRPAQTAPLAGATTARLQSQRGATANDAYVGGEYVGTDPDPFIRQSLQREHTARSTE